MFKVTEILKGVSMNKGSMNYVRDGGLADVMTAVGQILNHRIDGIENLVNCDGIIIEVTDEMPVAPHETFATSGALWSAAEIFDNVLDFVKGVHAAEWENGDYPYRKLVIQF